MRIPMTIPCELELICHSTFDVFNDFKMYMLCAFLKENDERMPVGKEAFVNGKRICYLDGIYEDGKKDAMNFMMSMLGILPIPIIEKEKYAILWWSKTSIPPKEACIVQELVKEDDKLVFPYIRTSINHKSLFVKAYASDVRNDSHSSSGM